MIQFSDVYDMYEAYYQKRQAMHNEYRMAHLQSFLLKQSPPEVQAKPGKENTIAADAEKWNKWLETAKKSDRLNLSIINDAAVKDETPDPIDWFFFARRMIMVARRIESPDSKKRTKEAEKAIRQNNKGGQSTRYNLDSYVNRLVDIRRGKMDKALSAARLSFLSCCHIVNAHAILRHLAKTPDAVNMFSELQTPQGK